MATIAPKTNKQVVTLVAKDDASRPADVFDQPVHIVDRAGWMQLAAIGAALFIAVIWAAFLDVPILVRGKGMLLSAHGIAEVTVPSRGTITKLMVGEGVDIKAGDIVARIDRPDLSMQLANKGAMLKDAEGRLDHHIDLGTRSAETQRRSDAARRAAAEQRVALMTRQLDVLRERDKNLRGLGERNFTTREQILASEAKLHEVEITISAAKAEIASINSQADLQDLQQERDTAKLEDEVSQLKTETTELRKLLAGESDIRSAYSGRVVEMKASAGNFIEVGTPLMTVLRDDDGDPNTGLLYALAYVAPNDGKNIKPGESVLVSPSSAERAEFGMVRGKVRSVAETPATTAGMMHMLKNDQMVKALQTDGAPFLVTIQLNPDPSTKSGYEWSSSKGPNLQLTSGTVADSEIVVRERRLLGIVIPPLARLFRGN